MTSVGSVSFANPGGPLDAMAKISSLSEVDSARLARGEVLGACVHLDHAPRCMSVETSYIVPAAPAAVLERMRTLDVDPKQSVSQTFTMEMSLPVGIPPQGQDFKRLYLDPNIRHTKWLLERARTATSDPNLNLNPAESARLADVFKQVLSRKPSDWMMEGAFPISDAWKEILMTRAAKFQAGGLKALPACERGEEVFIPHEEVGNILLQRPKVAAEFADVIPWFMEGKLPVENATPPIYWWGLSKIYTHGNLSLGGLHSQNLPDGMHVVEVEYYVSCQYYLSLILYRFWPYELDGREATLVWRGDYVMLPGDSLLKGIERLAAQKIMLIEIKRSIRGFIDEFGGKK